MDVLSPENRHKNMSHIRSKDTKPENRFVLLSGKPDSAIEFVISAIRENLT